MTNANGRRWMLTPSATPAGRDFRAGTRAPRLVAGTEVTS
jgi:hypothetical protein